MRVGPVAYYHVLLAQPLVLLNFPFVHSLMRHSFLVPVVPFHSLRSLFHRTSLLFPPVSCRSPSLLQATAIGTQLGRHRGS